MVTRSALPRLNSVLSNFKSSTFFSFVMNICEEQNLIFMKGINLELKVTW